MLKLFIILVFIVSFTSTNIFSQPFIGVTTKKVTMKEGPGREFFDLATLPRGSYVFVFSDTLENGYHHILDIETNVEGYIPSTYTKYYQAAHITTEKIFNPIGRTGNYNSEITIFNNTSKTLTLKLNDFSYIFSPQERNTISVSPGFYNYFGSAPGVIPTFGNETFSSGSGYEWEFFIVTERR